ncbi:filamentous hemagglutinin N-terminal domain-containing protein [bacterium]|nr:filamentous hemagglutinin N-terminal domain-containing protein [bacterium]
MYKFSKKIAAKSLLAIFLSLSCSSVFADTPILGGGANGGVITDLGGATINSNTSNAAQIGITGNGNIIRWNTLNIGKGKHLDFNFTKAGQVALNKVLGGQMSKFAGQLSTSGEAGRLIISNPAGMLFDKGVVVNANSLILTTKDVDWDGNLFGKLELTDNVDGLNSSIKIIDNKTSNFVIADDLNIIAPNIEIKQANDFLVNNSTRLITTDGVTFIANSPNIETSINANNTADTGNIYVYDAKIAFQNLDTGKIYVASRGDIKFEKSTLKNTELNSAKNITIQGGGMYTNRIDNSKLTAKTSITTSNLNSINNSTLKLTDTTKADNIKITINSNNNNHTKIVNSDLQGRFIYADKSIIESSILKTTKDLRVSGANITDSTLDSGFKVIAEGVNIKDSNITGTNTMTFDKGSVLDHVIITLNNAMNFSSPGSTTVHLNDATLINGSKAYSPKICANRSTIDNSKLTAAQDLSIIDGVLKNGSEVKSKYFIHDRHNIVTRDNSADNITVENSTLTAESDLNLRNGKFSGATLNAPNSVTLTNATAASETNSYNATINSTNNINITGAHNFKVKAAAADISIDNSELAKNDLNATNNLSIQNSVFTNDTNVKNSKKLNIKDTILKALNISNTDGINLEGINASSINIANSGNVTIKNSTSAADNLTPAIIDLLNNNNLVTDYNELKYTSNDFEDKITGNKYGENQKISYITGNVNISNVSNIDIINTKIQGNLTESLYNGDANLITSYIGGAYTPDRNNGETSVYQTSCVGKYISHYMVPVDNTDLQADALPNSNSLSNQSFKLNDEIDKSKYGSALNTKFQKHFTPRGFAAGDDEIAKRKNNILSTTKKSKNNSIITTQKFIAD